MVERAGRKPRLTLIWYGHMTIDNLVKEKG